MTRPFRKSTDRWQQRREKPEFDTRRGMIRGQSISPCCLDNGYCYANFSVESKASWHLIDSLNSTLSSGNYILACQFSRSSQKDRKALLGQSIETISDLVLLTPQMCHKSHIQTQTLRQLNCSQCPISKTRTVTTDLCAHSICPSCRPR